MHYFWDRRQCEMCCYKGSTRPCLWSTSRASGDPLKTGQGFCAASNRQKRPSETDRIERTHLQY
jgi:hypothetical protein